MYIHSGTITQDTNNDDIVGAETQSNLKLAFHFELPVMSEGAPAKVSVPGVPSVAEVKDADGNITTQNVPAIPEQPYSPAVPPQILKDGNGNVITAKFVLGKCINPNQDGSLNVCLHNSNRGKEILFKVETVNLLNNYYPQVVTQQCNDSDDSDDSNDSDESS